jgi:hypothetical protein
VVDVTRRKARRELAKLFRDSGRVGRLGRPERREALGRLQVAQERAWTSPAESSSRASFTMELAAMKSGCRSIESGGRYAVSSSSSSASISPRGERTGGAFGSPCLESERHSSTVSAAERADPR